MSVDIVTHLENTEPRAQGVRSASILEMSNSKFRFHENVVRSVPTMSRSHIPLPHQLLSPWATNIYSGAMETDMAAGLENNYEGSVLSLLESQQMLDSQMSWRDPVPWGPSERSRDTFSDGSVDDVDDIEKQDELNVQELRIPSSDNDTIDSKAENYDGTKTSSTDKTSGEIITNTKEPLSDEDEDFLEAFSSYSPLICESGSEYERALESVITETCSETNIETTPTVSETPAQDSSSGSDTLRAEASFEPRLENEDYVDLTSITMTDNCIDEDMPNMDLLVPSIDEMDLNSQDDLCMTTFRSPFFTELPSSSRRNNTFEITTDEKGTMCLSKRMEKEKRRTRIMNKVKEKLHRILGRRHQMFTK